jgi:hypothetical protein
LIFFGCKLYLYFAENKELRGWAVALITIAVMLALVFLGVSGVVFLRMIPFEFIKTFL